MRQLDLPRTSMKLLLHVEPEGQMAGEKSFVESLHRRKYHQKLSMVLSAELCSP